jgi:hypothetical protein
LQLVGGILGSYHSIGCMLFNRLRGRAGHSEELGHSPSSHFIATLDFIQF